MMMKNIIFLFVFLVGRLLFGQTIAAPTSTDKNEISGQDLKGATFPGGNDVFTKLVYSKFNSSMINYGSDDLQRTTIEFIVEKDGTLTNIKAVGSSESLNKEGVRIVKSITEKWQPATLKGEKVRIKFKQPIRLVVQ